MISQNVILSIVWGLIAVAVILTTGIVWIVAHGQQVDAGMTALAGSCVGALGGLLTNLHKTDAPALPPAPEPPNPDTSKIPQ